MIRKVLISIILLSTSLLADIKFAQKYEDALATAQKENKLIALTIVSTQCPWCHKLITETLKDTKIEAIVNKNFVYVVVNKDTTPIPNGLSARLVPTTYFLDKNGQKLTSPAIGFWEPEDFASYLADALKKAKRL